MFALRITNDTAMAHAENAELLIRKFALLEWSAWIMKQPMKLPAKTLKRIRKMKQEALLREVARKERILAQLKKRVVAEGE